MGEIDCAICGGPLPKSDRPGRPRTICNNPECFKAVRQFGAAKTNAIQRKRSGQTRTSKVCPQCNVEKTLNPDNFYIRKRNPDGGVAKWEPWCKPCKRVYQRALHDKRRDVYNANKRADFARTRGKMREDADLARIIRAKWAAQSRRERARNPEGYLQRQREYRQRVHANPKWHARSLETRRMADRLRREREGATRRNAKGRSGLMPQLPVAPVLAFVESLVLRERGLHVDRSGQDVADSYVCRVIGVDMRQLYAWRHGERQEVHFDIVDRILINSGALWFDVFDPDVYPEVEAIFDPPMAA